MLGLGFGEFLILGLMVLIFWGPEKMPEVARFISRMIVQFKRFTNDLKSNLKEDLDNLGGEDLKKWRAFQEKIAGNLRYMQSQDIPEYLHKIANTLDEDKKAIFAAQLPQKETTPPVSKGKKAGVKSASASVHKKITPKKALLGQALKQKIKKTGKVKTNLNPKNSPKF